MALKCKLVNEVKKTAEYPKICVHTSNELFVLFSKPNVGVVIDSKYHEAGFYSTNWEMNTFQDFNGKIVLENE